MKKHVLRAARAAACIVLLPAAVSAAEASLADLLRPAMLKMGILPNPDGLLDGTFEATLKWAPWLSSGLEASCSGSKAAAEATLDKAVMKAKGFQMDYAARLRLLEVLIPTDLGGGTGFGFGASVACAYTGLSQSVSGYKTALGETVYFNQDRMVHRISPTVDFDLAAVLGRVPALRADARGRERSLLHLPDGRPVFPPERLHGLPRESGRLHLGASHRRRLARRGSHRLFGKYGTVQEIVAGNYRTAIETYDDYSSISGEAFVEHRMTWLSGLVGIVPALRGGCGLAYETYGSQVTGPTLLWKTGSSLGSR